MFGETCHDDHGHRDVKTRYKVNEVKEVINSIESMDLNPHLKWEYAKIQIKHLGMIYGRRQALQKNMKKKK